MQIYVLYLLNINPKQIKAKDSSYELNKRQCSCGVILLGMGQFRQMELFTLVFVTFPQTSAAIHTSYSFQRIAGYSWHGYTTKESRGMTSWMSVTEVGQIC